ncbi:ERF family protein [Variovorax boronicumulans]|uniref:ERF family protein n=1 Tax=Variovorax boronicumulans TaxID=436515 RepID=UPI001C582BD0
MPAATLDRPKARTHAAPRRAAAKTSPPKAPARDTASNDPLVNALAFMGAGGTSDHYLKVMEMREAHRQREAFTAFHDSMAAFKSNAPEIMKDREGMTADGDAYRYASLGGVTAAIIGALAAQGITHRWEIKQDMGLVAVSCTLVHRLGHSERAEISGPPSTDPNLTPTQQINSTVTVLQRSTLLAATGLSTKDMDDDNGRGPRPEPRTAAAPAPAATYPAEAFAKSAPTWRKAVEAGTKTPEQLIAMLQAKHPLTNDQKQTIASWAPKGN